MTPKELLGKFEPKPAKQKAPAPGVQLASVRFSRCGKFLAAGGFDGALRGWDISADTPRELPALAGHGGWVQTLAFHPDGKRFVSGDSWGRLCVWNYADPTTKPLWSVTAHDGWLRKLAISPDGATIATCGADRKVGLWSSSDGKARGQFDQREDTFSVTFTPDGKSLITGDLRGAIRQWDVASGKATREFDAKSMYLYDRIQDVGGVRCLAVDPTGKFLAAGGGVPKSGGFVQGTWLVQVFDWSSGKEVSAIKGGNENDGYVLDLAWHPAGFVMAVASGQPGMGTLFFQRPGDGAPFFRTNVMPNCHALDLHPNGTRLVVAATNANSAGNGRVKGRGGEYPANVSPLHYWEFPKG